MQINPLIFISYHKSAPTIYNSFLQPIYVGKALKENTGDPSVQEPSNRTNIGLENAVGDDSGENISLKNNLYCELTGIYWVWKNLHCFPGATHIGHMQYRRHFILNQDLFLKAKSDEEKKAYGCIHFSKIDKSYLAKIGYSEENLRQILSHSDGVIPVPGDLSVVGACNLWNDYLFKIPGTHVDDLAALVKFLRECSSAEADSFEKYLEQPNKLMYQMFILSRKDFQEYCSFLFSLLFALEKRLNFEKYTVNGQRTLGYLGELIFGWYFLNLQKKKNLINLGVTFVEGI